MKKLIVLSILGIFILSSFSVENYNVKKNKVAVDLQTWYYRCPNGDTGSFLMPRGSTKDQARDVASVLC